LLIQHIIILLRYNIFFFPSPLIEVVGFLKNNIMNKTQINNEITTTRTRNGFFHEIRVEDTKWFVNIDQFNPTQESIFIENEKSEVFKRQGTTKKIFIQFIYNLIN